MRPPGPAGSSPARSAAPPPGAEAPAKPWEHAKGPARGSGSDPLAARFVASLAHDVRLYEADIEGSLAHARMLREAGLIDADDLARIEEGLAEIRREIGAAGREPGGIGSWPGWRQELEDVHMCLEAALIEKAGDAGRKLHTGRSRNDQVALDLKLWLRGACAEVGSRIGEVLGALESLARRQGDLVMPAYTHLQRAQPACVGGECAAWHAMLARDRSLLAQLAGDPLGLGLCPLGAGAVAGSCLPLDRRHTAGALGFVRPAPSSIDATASRDEALDFVYALARTAMHLSRWAEQWVIYCTSEFALLALDERFTTGSSMMPQKRNPDMLELIRGRCGGVYGDLVALLTICKGLPVGYSRDLQEDKRHVFSAFDTVSDCLAMAARVIATARFVPERLAESLHRHGGFLDATSLAEYLVTRGVPFRTAHQVVGGLVRECERRGVTSLSQLEPEQITEAVRGAGIRDVQVGPEVAGWLGPAAVVARYQTEGNAGLSGYRAYFGFGPRAARSAGPLLEPDPPAGPRGDGVAGVTSPVTAPRAGPPDVPGAEDPSAGPGAPESDHDPVLFAAGGPIAVAPGGPDAGLIEAYASIGRTLDDLPYTDEFERLYERAGAEARGLSRHRLLHRLHNLRKAGRLPRVGKASASPIRLPEAEERTLRELVAEVAGSLGQRDQLPYTPGFDVVAEQFEARSGRALSRHDLWRLIAKLAK